MSVACSAGFLRSATGGHRKGRGRREEKKDKKVIVVSNPIILLGNCPQGYTKVYMGYIRVYRVIHGVYRGACRGYTGGLQGYTRVHRDILGTLFLVLHEVHTLL